MYSEQPDRPPPGVPLTDADALNASEGRFYLLVDAIKDYAIIRLDADGCVASWNAGAERIKGYRVDEIVG